jgi:hypothetical protein
MSAFSQQRKLLTWIIPSVGIVCLGSVENNYDRWLLPYHSAVHCKKKSTVLMSFSRAICLQLNSGVVFECLFTGRGGSKGPQVLQTLSSSSSLESLTLPLKSTCTENQLRKPHLSLLSPNQFNKKSLTNDYWNLCLTFYTTLVIYVTSVLTFRSTEFCPQSKFSLSWSSQRRTIISLRSMNRLVFVIKMQFVFREVETEFLLYFRQTSVFKWLTNQRCSIILAMFQADCRREI